MAKTESFVRIAMSFAGTVSAPHFDRTAFKVKRTFATLAADGQSANLNFTPEEQHMQCLLAPHIFSPVDNGWGRQGWTTMLIEPATEADISAALATAHAHAVGKSTSKI